MTTVEPRHANPDPEPDGPDGGWGWVLVGAFFVCNSLVFGLMRSSGIFFVEFVQYFDESAQAISWISSIGLAAQQFFSELLQPLLLDQIRFMSAIICKPCCFCVFCRPTGVSAL